MKKSTHTLPIFSKKSAILSLKKDMVELLVSQYEEVASKAIMFFRNGNKGLLQNPDEKKLPHVIYFFTNENLEFILDCLSENELYSEKVRQEKEYSQKLKASEELKALADAQTKLMFLKQQIRFRLPAATLFLPMARSRA